MLAIFVDSNIVILGVCGSKIGDFLQFSKKLGIFGVLGLKNRRFLERTYLGVFQGVFDYKRCRI